MQRQGLLLHLFCILRHLERARERDSYSSCAAIVRRNHCEDRGYAGEVAAP